MHFNLLTHLNFKILQKVAEESLSLSNRTSNDTIWHRWFKQVPSLAVPLRCCYLGLCCRWLAGKADPHRRLWRFRPWNYELVRAGETWSLSFFLMQTMSLWSCRKCFCLINSVLEPKSLSCAPADGFEPNALFTLLKICRWLGTIAPNPSKSNLLWQSQKLNNLWKMWFVFSWQSCHCEHSRNIPAIKFWLALSLFVKPLLKAHPILAAARI